MDDFQDHGHRQGQALAPYRVQRYLTPIDQSPQGEALHEQQAGFKLRNAIEILIRRSWIIFGIIAVVMAAAVAMVLLETPMYQASATVEVKRQETRIMDGGEVNPTVIADSEHMLTQYALLRSRALAERVAESLDLASDARYASQSASRADRLAQATSTVQRGIEVVPVQRSRVIEVRFRSPYPEEAARIATATAENYIQSDLERRFNATSYARTFLEERLQVTKTALEDAERKLVAYSRESRIIDLGRDNGENAQSTPSLDAASLIALNNSLTEAQQERITAEQRFIGARDNASARSALSSDTIKVLAETRVKLSTEYQEKLRTFKPDFPEMRDLAARIEAIDREVASEQAKLVTGLESAFRAAQAREVALQKRVDELKGEVQDAQTRSIDYNILSREVDTLRSQYNALLQRFKEVSIVSGISESQVSIVDRAEAPKRPYSPNLRNALLMAFAIALALALAVALAIEYIDDTIKTPEDVKSKLGLPVVGLVPKAPGKETVMEALADKRSAISEAFGSARTALQFSTNMGSPRSIVITGNRPAEGKTSTATGIALAFAATGKRVLIIDGDMRRPSFLSDQSSSIGLSGLLTRESPLSNEVIAGELGNVALLPAGVTPPNPAELLTGPRFSQILAEATAAYDIVVVDGPPVLDFSDSPLLASACEATILVVQSGAIRRPIVRRTMDRLWSANANIVGVILTKFDLKRTGYTYGYDYAGYGAYGYNMDATKQEQRQRRMISLFVREDSGDKRSG